MCAHMSIRVCGTEHTHISVHTLPLPLLRAPCMHITQLAEQLHAIMNQYDNEDFDLGIKQFMIEQAIQQVTWAAYIS